MPASYRSVFITRINCGLFHLLCVLVFGSTFSVNKMNISSTLTQENNSSITYTLLNSDYV